MKRKAIRVARFQRGWTSAGGACGSGGAGAASASGSVSVVATSSSGRCVHASPRLPAGRRHTTPTCAERCRGLSTALRLRAQPCACLRHRPSAPARVDNRPERAHAQVGCRPDEPDEDFSAEIQAHLDLEIARLVADGRSPADARAAALRAFGNVAKVQERYYEANRWMWLEQMVQDLRYGLRGLRKSPAFVATTVLTLAVALSLLTVVFTIFNAYVLRPFAVRDPGALHRIIWRAQDDGGSQFRWRDYEALRQRRDLFEAAVAEDTRLVASEGRTLSADFVSENYFETLAPRLLLGRALGAADARAPVAVLSHQAWTRLFAGDPAVLGRDLDLDGRKFTIVGVLRQEFTGLDDYPKDVWIPLVTYAELVRPDILGANQSRRIEVTVRLRAGVTAAQAEGALTPMMPALVDAKPDRRDLRAEVRPHSTPNRLSLELLAVLSPVFAAFVLVLVTACANVSNVMLSRAIARQREIAVRLSLGASRGRVVRQLLTEGLLIAVLAGAAGLALAAWTLRIGTVMLFKTLPPSLAALLRVAPLLFDYRVFAFALTVGGRRHAAVRAGAGAAGVAAHADRRPARRAHRIVQRLAPAQHARGRAGRRVARTGGGGPHAGAQRRRR